jgi:hypothetical protein
MSDTVTIPADEAKRIAAALRQYVAAPGGDAERWADLLDPKPPTLRERVAVALAERNGDTSAEWLCEADDVLAVARDAIAALPGHSAYGEALVARSDIFDLLDGAESLAPWRGSPAPSSSSSPRSASL